MNIFRAWNEDTEEYEYVITADKEVATRVFSAGHSIISKVDHEDGKLIVVEFGSGEVKYIRNLGQIEEGEIFS